MQRSKLVQELDRELRKMQPCCIDKYQHNKVDKHQIPTIHAETIDLLENGCTVARNSPNGNTNLALKKNKTSTLKCLQLTHTPNLCARTVDPVGPDSVNGFCDIIFSSNGKLPIHYINIHPVRIHPAH
jgi:hypothetical protein